MAANDTIADMLTRIRNANLARHQTVDIPSTRMTRSIAHVLQEEGFIESFDLEPYFVIVFELLGPNLYQLMKERKDRKCNLREIQVF